MFYPYLKFVSLCDIRDFTTLGTSVYHIFSLREYQLTLFALIEVEWDVCIIRIFAHEIVFSVLDILDSFTS